MVFQQIMLATGFLVLVPRIVVVQAVNGWGPDFNTTVTTQMPQWTKFPPPRRASSDRSGKAVGMMVTTDGNGSGMTRGEKHRVLMRKPSSRQRKRGNWGQSGGDVIVAVRQLKVSKKSRPQLTMMKLKQSVKHHTVVQPTYTYDYYKPNYPAGKAENIAKFYEKKSGKSNGHSHGHDYDSSSYPQQKIALIKKEKYGYGHLQFKKKGKKSQKKKWTKNELKVIPEEDPPLTPTEVRTFAPENRNSRPPTAAPEELRGPPTAAPDGSQFNNEPRPPTNPAQNRPTAFPTPKRFLPTGTPDGAQFNNTLEPTAAPEERSRLPSSDGSQFNNEPRPPTNPVQNRPTAFPTPKRFLPTGTPDGAQFNNTLEPTAAPEERSRLPSSDGSQFNNEPRPPTNPVQNRPTTFPTPKRFLPSVVPTGAQLNNTLEPGANEELSSNSED